MTLTFFVRVHGVLAGKKQLTFYHLCQKKVTLFVTRKEIEKKGLVLMRYRRCVTQRTSHTVQLVKKLHPQKLYLNRV